MFACIEYFGYSGNELVIYEVNDRAVELAEELNREDANDDTVDDFLDNCEEPELVVELLGAIARGNAERESNGTYLYCGDEAAGGLGKTRDEACLAYVAMRLKYGA